MNARRTPQVDVEALRREGFTVVDGVFSKDEVERVRELLFAVRDREHARGLCLTDPDMPANVRVIGDLLGKDELRELDYLTLEPRIVECARQALGRDLLYFGDSDFQTGEGERGWHRDNADRDDLTGPDWTDDAYSLVRIGLYLQDHKRHSGGLQVKPGSHLASMPEGRPAERVECTAGDVAIWNLRITHSGNFVRTRGLDVCLEPRDEERFPRSLRVPEERERIAVFITFGLARDRDTEHYIDWWRGREDRLEHWRRSGRSAGVEALAAKRGVALAFPTADYGSKAPRRTRHAELAGTAR